ncbi:Fic family protein [Schleiferilactobacillus shenzhenensis]|uniref:Fido domain-containing protein n=1 Tax=Schleiferilactobacillus shenzhenensis LY-73 TaxID=1231336 RepID=U4TLY6_9LACO|nr:Fic family protein [Schleiferilactobacillus shenzhenensis]ERL64405.1 hypothetical protein L248_0947 [Schleiferilactobacillus shenzhenensis LY-73]
MADLRELLKKITRLKAEMDHYRPLTPTQVKMLEKNIRIEHVWTSNAIEGSHLDRYETASILDAGVTVNGASVKDTLAAIDLNDAYEYMMDLVAHKQPLSQQMIRDLNRIATLQTANPKSEAGLYRVIDVWPNGLQDHPYVSPFEIRQEMAKLIRWSRHAQATEHPVQYAADLHQRFVTIHPFVDGNGRTARLLMNFALTQAGYPVINVMPDEASRNTYMVALEDARNGHRASFERLIANYVQTELVRRNKMLALNERNQSDAVNETSPLLQRYLEKHGEDQ